MSRKTKSKQEKKVGIDEQKRGQCLDVLGDHEAHRMRVALLLESLIDKMPERLGRTVRTLWQNQWDEAATAYDLRVSRSAVRVALYRFRKAASMLASEPDFQESYQNIFC